MTLSSSMNGASYYARLLVVETKEVALNVVETKEVAVVNVTNNAILYKLP